MIKGNLSNARVILLSGEEFQRLERLAEIIERTVDEPTRDFNFNEFLCYNYTRNKLSELIAPLSELIVTFPMMAERRVVALRNFDSLPAETCKQASEVIRDTSETTLVIVEGEKAKLSPAPPKQYFISEFFKPIYDSKLHTWIQGRFAKRGRKATPGAAALLANNMGNVLGELDSEIEKTTVASPGSGTITEEDAARVVGAFRHDTVWNLRDAVGLGDFDRAVSILKNLLESEKNREAFYIATIAKHLLKLAEYNSLRKSGITHSEAVSRVNESPYFWNLNKMNAQAGNFGQPEVRRALALLTDADSKLKRYTVDKGLMLELLLPRIIPAKERSSKA